MVTQLKEIWKTTYIPFQMEDDLSILVNGRQPQQMDTDNAKKKMGNNWL